MAKDFAFLVATTKKTIATPVFRCAGYLALTAALTACSPAADEDLLGRAQTALDEGNIRAAEIDVRTALQESPDNAEGRRLLGEISLYQQNPAAAAEQFERALQAVDGDADNHAELHVLYARALLAARRSEQLLAQHEQGDFSSVANHPRYLAILATAQAEAGQLQNGRDSLTAALTAAPDDPLVVTTDALFQLLYSQNLEAAQTILQDTVVAHPDYADAWSLLGGIQRMTRAFSEAEASYAKAVELNPRRFTDRLNLISVQLDHGDTEAANYKLQAMLASDPDHPGVNYLYGRMLVEGGENVEALTALANVLSVLPDHPGSLYLSAVANIAEGNLATARSQLDRLLAAQRDNVQGHLLMANLHLLTEDPQGAEEVARSILQDDNTNYAAMSLLATALNAQGRSSDEETIELYQRMAQARPDAAEPRWALGSALMQAGDADAGAEQFQLARELSPEPTVAQERMIQTRLANGDVAGARADAEAYAQQQPQSHRPHLFLARIAMKQNDLDEARTQFGEAEERLHEALAEEPDNLELQVLMIDALMGQGKLEEADVLLTALPPDLVNDPGALLARGRIALAEDRPAEAEPLLRRALTESPNSMTLLWLSGAIGAQGRVDQAINLLTEWLADNPADVLVRNELASIYVRLGREEEAREEYQRVVERGPDNVFVLNNLAWLLREDDPQQALEHIKRARELSPRNPRIIDTQAMIQLEIGEIQEALSLNQAALDLAPEAPDLLYNRALILHANGESDEAYDILQTLAGAENAAYPQKEQARALLAEWQQR